MKKFSTTGNIVLLIWAVICYIGLAFLPDFVKEPQLQTHLWILLCTHIFLSTTILNSNRLDIMRHNEHHNDLETLRALVQIIKDTNELQENLVARVGQVAVDVYNIKCAVDRIENQTKPKTPTTRKKKEA